MLCRPSSPLLQHCRGRCADVHRAMATIADFFPLPRPARSAAVLRRPASNRPVALRRATSPHPVAGHISNECNCLNWVCLNCVCSYLSSPVAPPCRAAPPRPALSPRPVAVPVASHLAGSGVTCGKWTKEGGRTAPPGPRRGGAALATPAGVRGEGENIFRQYSPRHRHYSRYSLHHRRAIWRRCLAPPQFSVAPCLEPPCRAASRQLTPPCQESDLE